MVGNESITNLLDSSKTFPQTCLKKFLDTVEQTLVNYSHADSKIDADSDEMKLVESLCGTLTSELCDFH